MYAVHIVSPKLELIDILHCHFHVQHIKISKDWLIFISGANWAMPNASNWVMLGKDSGTFIQLSRSFLLKSSPCLLFLVHPYKCIVYSRVLVLIPLL